MFIKRIKTIVRTGVVCVMPFMNAGRFEQAAGIHPNSDPERCYIELNGGREATSVDDPLLRAVVENFYRYDFMNGEELMTALRTADSGYKASIVEWILIHKKNYTREQICRIRGNGSYGTCAAVYPGSMFGVATNPWNPPVVNPWIPQYGASAAPYSSTSPGMTPGAVPYTAQNAFTPNVPSSFEKPSMPLSQPVVVPQKPLPVPQFQIPQQQSRGMEPPAISSCFSSNNPQGSPAVSTAAPIAEDAPVVTVKIDVIDKKTIKISFDDQLVSQLTYDSGLWVVDSLQEDALDLLPLEPNVAYASFEFGGANFKIYLNGDVEVFGRTHVPHCVLECPKEGKLIIPEGRELQVNRFVCLTRGKTIENFGRIGLSEACFCFEQTIINHGDITSTSTGPNKGAILLLKSSLSGGAVDVKVITLEDRSYPEYGCQCFYGFDRKFDEKMYPHYGVSTPDWNVVWGPDACFLDYPPSNPRNYTWFQRDKHLLMPFNGHSREKDYNIPFTGDAVVVFVGNGNGNPKHEKKNFKIRLCDSLSGRILSELSGKVVTMGFGIPINEISRAKVSSRMKIFFHCSNFMILEKSPTEKVSTPAIYFFKL